MNEVKKHSGHLVAARRWTTERPIALDFDWYFWRSNPTARPYALMYFSDSWRFGNEVFRPVGGEWSGPLAPPTDAPVHKSGCGFVSDRYGDDAIGELGPDCTCGASAPAQEWVKAEEVEGRGRDIATWFQEFIEGNACVALDGETYQCNQCKAVAFANGDFEHLDDCEIHSAQALLDRLRGVA